MNSVHAAPFVGDDTQHRFSERCFYCGHNAHPDMQWRGTECVFHETRGCWTHFACYRPYDRWTRYQLKRDYLFVVAGERWA